MGAIGDAAKKWAASQAMKPIDLIEKRGRQRIEHIQKTAQDEQDKKIEEKKRAAELRDAEKEIARQQKEAKAAFDKAVKNWARGVRSGDVYEFGSRRVQFYLNARGVVSMPINGMKEMTPAEVFLEYGKEDTDPRKVG